VEELRGQTVLVFISVLLLGLFTVAIDYVLVFLVKVLATT
jgi:preprotein translocase subunit SecE